MITRLHAVGYENCKALIEEHKHSDLPVYVVFVGTKNDEGKNWCPDCVRAEPIFESAIESLKDDAIVIWVEVGDRPYWKNPTNEFRHDADMKIRQIPTVVRFSNGVQASRLEFPDPEDVAEFFSISTDVV